MPFTRKQEPKPLYIAARPLKKVEKDACYSALTQTHFYPTEIRSYMKKKLLILTAITVSLNAFAQETLQHFDPAVDSPVADEFPGTDGYYTGHNTYSDEEFAEKYEITGDGTVIGVSAIHVGVDGTSSMNASYKIYEVGGNGLPSTQKASKNVPYTDIPVDGSTYSTMFTNAVSVTDEFFVSFNLGDYVHNDPGTKRIAITQSRRNKTIIDLGVFGRNAIRWHSHGADWKDYRTENFQSLQPAVYFSLFHCRVGTSFGYWIEWQRRKHRKCFPQSLLIS